MYTISARLKSGDEEFKTMGSARIRAKIVSGKYNDDGSVHACTNQFCPVQTTHTLTAKSKKPFAMLVRGNFFIASDEKGFRGASVLARDIDGVNHCLVIHDPY